MTASAVLGTLADYADAIRSARSDDERYRYVIGFVTDFGVVDDREARVHSIAERPPTTGDVRWDALLAGIAEHLAFHFDLMTPAWVYDGDRFLESFWFPVDLPSIRVQAFVTAPASLARRGIFIDRRDLERV